MNHIVRYLLLASLLFSLSACSGMPQLFWDTDEGADDSPAYARRASTAGGIEKSRVPLDVPPELRAELELPEGAKGESAANTAPVPQQYRKAVAGKAVALDARLYDVQSMQLFSATVDAMTSLNLPVHSIDSPSGIVTTDWVKKVAGSTSLLGLGDMFGGGNKPKGHRYRYVVRIFKVDADNQSKSRLEIRLISQVYLSNHWINRKFNNKPSQDLFSAVEKQLGLIQTLQSEAVETNPE